jgi:hypothetical protein
MQLVYTVLCIVGTVLPLAQFLPWLGDHGLDFPLVIGQAIANPISAFAWSDLMVSAVVVIVFVLIEGRRIGMRHAWTSLLGLLVGISLALPLFLLLRERHMRQTGTNSSFNPPSLRGAA